jgi:hypothetical protein
MYSAILNLLATLPLAACCESGFVQAATEQQRPEAPASAEAPATYPQSIDGRLVLSREAASADGALEFEVAIGACSDDECPVLVSLLRGNTILDQRPTNWSSSTAQPITEELEPGWGAGDPGRPAAVRAWSTGEEEGYLGTVVRPVRLAMDTYGLLIDQLPGSST